MSDTDSRPTTLDDEMRETLDASGPRTAVVYRMVMPGHLCPYGLKTVDLLDREGFEIDDRHLTTEEETTAFRERWDVETTPQTFVDGELVGTLDDVREYVGRSRKDGDGESYWPVLSLFAITFFMALGAAWVAEDRWFSTLTIQWFVAFTMCGLGYLKVRDVESFSTMFLNYDLLARRWVRYGYVYPFAETGAGILMIPSITALTLVAAPVAFLIGTVGAISVIKAVWVDGRELKCACVGGSSNVPLGFVSLTENVVMVAMAVWMVVRVVS